MNVELIGALNELERERGISKEILLDAIEAAILSAYKRGNEDVENVRVEVSDESGSIRIFAQKTVASEVEDEANEISLDAAREINPGYGAGDVIEVEVTPGDFGRIAAQTAKQVVIQRIREAERTLIFEEYSEREGDVLTGIVQRSEHRNVLVDLGKVEAILPPSEQISAEDYPHGDRVKVFISEVRQTPRGPQVIVSRTHPGLLKRLFELEVPEIHDGIVEIMAVSREAGNRSKIAVKSNDLNVDPVGACVGPRGMRVQTIVQELKGEKIDIVEHSADPERFIGKALSPARVLKVFANEEEKTARAIVPDHQLSLAIGREGQNARLAARLTGWKIDIKSEAQMAELALLEAQRAAEERRALELEEEQTTEVEEAFDEVAIDSEGETAVEVEPDPHEPEAEPADEEPPAAEAEEDLVLEIPTDLLADLGDDSEEKVESAPTRVRKSRAARKELQTMIEEEVLEEEEEPLPSLFVEDEEADEGLEPAEAGRTSPIDAFHRRWSAPQTDDEKKEKDEREATEDKKKAKEKDDEKVVLRDLSELGSLFGLEDEDS